MKIAYFPNSSGSRWWRLQDPLTMLANKYPEFETRVATKGINDEISEWADVYVLQGCIDKDGIALLAAHQGENGKKIVVDQDDNIGVEEDNPFKKAHEIGEADRVLEITMQIADLVTTTNPYLASKLEKLTKNVVILPNYMDMKRWDLPRKVENISNQIRIGWSGSQTHLEDLKMIVPALRRISKEYPKVVFVFVGDLRIKEIMDGLPIEIMTGVPFDAWPSKLHSLGLDVALAPLRDSEFNRCKSNIKRLEYGIAKYPAVFSPTIYNEPYFEDKGLGLIAGNEDQWYEKIKRMIDNPNLRHSVRRLAYQNIKENFDLEKNIGKWEEAYGHLYS